MQLCVYLPGKKFNGQNKIVFFGSFKQTVFRLRRIGKHVLIFNVLKYSVEIFIVNNHKYCNYSHNNVNNYISICLCQCNEL